MAQFTSPEVAEIRAYERTALHAFELVKDRPITTSFMSQLQGELFSDAQDRPRITGQLRQDQVWIGPKDRPITEARFVPPPNGDQLRVGLDAWAEWVQAAHRHLPPVLRQRLLITSSRRFTRSATAMAASADSPSCCSFFSAARSMTLP
jgi:hypothetical protein